MLNHYNRSAFSIICQRRESGRSMVEIFGVLAVVAVLSILALLGYRYAMEYQRANEIIGTVNIERASILTQHEANQTFTASEGRIMSLYPYKREILADGFVVIVNDIPSGVCASILNRRWDEPQYLIDGMLVDNFNVDVCYDAGGGQITVTMGFVFGWSGDAVEDPVGSECDLTAPCLTEAGSPDERSRVEEYGLCICKCPTPNDMYDMDTGKCECPDPVRTELKDGQCVCPTDKPQIFYDEAKNACVCPPDTTPQGADLNTCLCADHLTSDNRCVKCSGLKTIWDSTNEVCVCDPAVTCDTGKVKNANCDCVCDSGITCLDGKVKDADCNCICPVDCVGRADGKTLLDTTNCTCVCPTDTSETNGHCCAVGKVWDADAADGAGECVCDPDDGACSGNLIKDADCDCVCPLDCSARTDGKTLVGADCTCICPLGQAVSVLGNCCAVNTNGQITIGQDPQTLAQRCCSAEEKIVAADSGAQICCPKDPNVPNAYYYNESTRQCIRIGVCPHGHDGVAFVIDASGSMAGNKLRKVKDAIIGSVALLPAGVKTGVYTFSGSAGTPLSYGNNSAATVSSAVSNITAGGNTCISCGLDAAWQDTYKQGHSPIMIVLTDGSENVYPSINGMTNVNTYMQMSFMKSQCSNILEAYAVGLSASNPALDIVGAIGGGGYRTATVDNVVNTFKSLVVPMQCIPGPAVHCSASGSESSCPDGYTCADRKATICPKGYQCRGNVKTICPAGSFSVAGAAECTSCAAGTYQKDAGKDVCTSCPNNATCTGTGNTTFACSNGYYRTSATASSCTKCGAGYACSGGIRTQCTAGTYSAAGSSSCSACPSGKWQKDAGQSSCDNCPTNATCTATAFTCNGGYYRTSASSTSCSKCGAGKTSTAGCVGSSTACCR